MPEKTTVDPDKDLEESLLDILGPKAPAAGAPPPISSSPFPQQTSLPPFESVAERLTRQEKGQPSGAERPEAKRPVPDFLRKTIKEMGINLPSHISQVDLANTLEFIKLKQKKQEIEAESRKAELKKPDLRQLISDISGAVESRIKNDLSLTKNLTLNQEKLNEMRRQYSIEEAAKYEPILPGISATVQRASSIKGPPPPPGYRRVIWPNISTIRQDLRGRTGLILEGTLPAALAQGAVEQ